MKQEVKQFKDQKQYNYGYTNRETYHMAMWLLYKENLMIDIIRDIGNSGLNIDITYNLAAGMEDFFYFYLDPKSWGMEDMPHDFVQILFNVGSLHRVDWVQLAIRLYDKFKLEEALYKEQLLTK